MAQWPSLTRQGGLVSWFERSRLEQAPVHAALQAFLQQECHPGMDLIGATLKYEMDLRDLRAAENLAQSKLTFFFGPQVGRSPLLSVMSASWCTLCTAGHCACMLAPHVTADRIRTTPTQAQAGLPAQGLDPLQMAKLQTCMLPMLLDMALLSHVITAMARKPTGAPLAAPSLSLPAQPPAALSDLGGMLGQHASAPQSLAKLARRLAPEASSFTALPPAKRPSGGLGALPPLPQQLMPPAAAPWLPEGAPPGLPSPLQPCNSSLCSSETRLPPGGAADLLPPRRPELDLDLLRSRASSEGGPNAFAWAQDEAAEAGPHPSQALPTRGPATTSRADLNSGRLPEAPWLDAGSLDSMQACLGLDEFPEWLDVPGSLQSLQELSLPATSLEQRHHLRQQQQPQLPPEHQPEGGGSPWYLGCDRGTGNRLACLFPP